MSGANATATIAKSAERSYLRAKEAVERYKSVCHKMINQKVGYKIKRLWLDAFLRDNAMVDLKNVQRATDVARLESKVMGAIFYYVTIIEKTALIQSKIFEVIICSNSKIEEIRCSTEKVYELAHDYYNSFKELAQEIIDSARLVDNGVYYKNFVEDLSKKENMALLAAEAFSSEAKRIFHEKERINRP